MAERNTVLRSIETPESDRCVDVFRRPDGTFGYAVFRRDVEDARGWFPITAGDQGRYATAEAALQGAVADVPWLAEVMGNIG
ncbi:MAG TPA: hypothetical protein VKB51_13115 [bacterium]|nr:hypothetical protein [bacterium]